MTDSFDNIPAELQILRQWVCWRFENRDGKLTKVPHHRNGYKADPSDPSTWSTFADVVAAYADGVRRFNGIGFVFAAGGDYTGIDLDHHCDPATGQLDELGGRYVRLLNSYTELSQSGTGVHVLVRGTIPSSTGRRDAKMGVEMYSAGRFFVMTGRRLPDTSPTIEPRQSQIETMFQQIFGSKNEVREAEPPQPANLSDSDLIEQAGRAKNGALFSQLWRGDWKGAGYGSQSEADASLLSILRFWTSGDKVRSFALFAQSGLNRKKWQRGDYREATWAKVDHGEVFCTKRRITAAKSAKRDELQRAIADPRPKLRLPGPDRLLSDFASELGQILREEDIFYRNGDVVILADHDLKPITPQTLRSWAEQYFIGYRVKMIGDNSFQFDVTMSDNDARGTLAAQQFTDALRRVRCLNRARLPIIGRDGNLTLLPTGYDTETQTLTLDDVEYSPDMGLPVAIKVINDLLAEFRFADDERSKAVAVSAMVGLYANQLLPKGALRPCFIFSANAEGAGKTTLARICIAPTLGAMPTGCKSNEEDEVRKVLTTAIREGRLVIFFDNLKGKLSSPALEAFLTAADWTDRKLGVNETVNGDNLATVFVTSNGVTVSPDMRRRSLFADLHLEEERAEDKSFKRDLELPQILKLRPEILAALCAIVKNWDSKGRPQPSRGHSAFPAWANICGGIVEAAEFGCPFQTADVIASADPDSEDMRKLASEMANDPSEWTFGRIVQAARDNGLFERIIGTDDRDLDRPQKSALAKLLGRYDHRLIRNHRFFVEGKGKTRRYRVEPGNGGNGGNGPSGEKNPQCVSEFGPKDHTDHADHPEIFPK
jgi:hypothetical protein